MHRLARLAPAAAACAIALSPVARASSPDSVPVSPEAAHTAGAVLASDDLGGGGWYNPASLGAVTRDSIQVGASTYAESGTLIDDAAQATLPWGSSSGDIRTWRYASVPSVLSYSFRLREGLGLSIGVWTPYHDYEGGTTTLTSSGPYPSTPALNATFAATYSFTERRDDTWGGVAVGWQATPRLRVGAMLQGAYSTDVWTIDLNTSLKTGSADPLQGGSHVVYSERGDQGVLGLRPLLGLQWDGTAKLRVAAAVRGPTVRVFGWGPVDKFLSTAVLLPNTPPTETQTTESTEAGRGISAVEPVRIYGGLRWIRDRATLAFEMDWHPALNGQLGDFKEGWNARLGGTWRVNPDLFFGAGLFHDSESAASTAAASALRYVGFTTGVIYRAKSVVKARHGGNDWDLVSGLAVRGAYGWGTYRGISIVPVEPGGGGVLSFPDANAKVIEGSISFVTAIIF